MCVCVRVCHCWWEARFTFPCSRVGDVFQLSVLAERAFVFPMGAFLLAKPVITLIVGGLPLTPRPLWCRLPLGRR